MVGVGQKRGEGGRQKKTNPKNLVSKFRQANHLVDNRHRTAPQPERSAGESSNSPATAASAALDWSLARGTAHMVVAETLSWCIENALVSIFLLVEQEITPGHAWHNHIVPRIWYWQLGRQQSTVSACTNNFAEKTSISKYIRLLYLVP